MILLAVAYNPRYVDTLLDQLEWAFQKFDFEVQILTFWEYRKQFRNNNRAKFTFYKKPIHLSKDKWWFPFHNYSHLPIVENDFDHCVFLEEDMMFTKIVDETYFHDNKISLFVTEKYLSVLNQKMNVIYPRIWEGCLFVPKNILLQAIEDNIIFGNRKLTPDWKNESDQTKYPNLYTKHNGRFITIDEFILSNKSDTMFEFSMWCFSHKIEVINYAKDDRCEEGEIVIHFRGFEIFPWHIEMGEPVRTDLRPNDEHSFKYLNYLYLTCLYDSSYLQRSISICSKELKIRFFNKLNKLNVDWMKPETLENHYDFIEYLQSDKIKLV